MQSSGSKFPLRLEAPGSLFTVPDLLDDDFLPSHRVPELRGGHLQLGDLIDDLLGCPTALTTADAVSERHLDLKSFRDGRGNNVGLEAIALLLGRAVGSESGGDLFPTRFHGSVEAEELMSQSNHLEI